MSEVSAVKCRRSSSVTRLGKISPFVEKILFWAKYYDPMNRPPWFCQQFEQNWSIFSQNVWSQISNNLQCHWSLCPGPASDYGTGLMSFFLMLACFGHRNLRTRTSMLAQVLQIFLGKNTLKKNWLISTLDKAIYILQRNIFSAVFKTSLHFTK
jgi:hypothetical protein